MRRWIAMGLVAVTCGCGSKKSGGESASGGGGGEAASGLPAEVAAWMPKDALAAFAGTWAGRVTLRSSGTISMAGDPAAIEIKGGQATAFDGTKDHTLGFAVDSPCEATFTEATKTKDGGEMKQMVSVQFALVGGKVEIGSGSVGLRKGKAAVVCTSSSMDGVFVLDDKGKCQNFAKHFGTTWEGKPATCAWATKDGKDTLTIGEGDRARVLYADGDVLRSEQFTEFVQEGYWRKTADLAEAKQVTAWEISASDDAKGKDVTAGTAGDLTSVRNIVASLAADAKATEGKDTKVTGFVTRVGVTSIGKTYVDVVDAGGLASPKLSCYLAAGAGLQRWAKVTIAGKIRGGSSPQLDDCALTK